jgi:hypothetical protein
MKHNHSIGKSTAAIAAMCLAAGSAMAQGQTTDLPPQAYPDRFFGGGAADRADERPTPSRQRPGIAQLPAPQLYPGRPRTTEAPARSDPANVQVGITEQPAPQAFPGAVGDSDSDKKR